MNSPRFPILHDDSVDLDNAPPIRRNSIVMADDEMDENYRNAGKETISLKYCPSDKQFGYPREVQLSSCPEDSLEYITLLNVKSPKALNLDRLKDDSSIKGHNEHLRFENQEGINFKLNHLKRKHSFTKEKNQIISIMKLVCKWKTLCYDSKNAKTKAEMTKLDAAKKFHMRKKTLDDYLMFLRLGMVYGFPFDKENCLSPFGKLRKFVKKARKVHRKQRDKNSLDVEDLLEKCASICSENNILNEAQCHSKIQA